ncbi:1-acyl-sn-glycerol-3-phosphate acyltransferase [Patescibacteria group bacterium]|nr:1-acyl-sn-glycerol-3-phosphate acyltransferase [Patescibacteria group bacterium]
MSRESLNFFKDSVIRTVEKSAINLPKFKEEFDKKGFKGVGHYLLEAVNVRIDYTKEADPSFSGLRQKLQKEPGLIIGNHPGYIEIPAILNTLDREDVKFMVTQHLYEHFVRQFGEQYFVPNAKNISELKPVLQTVKSHIKTGGAVMIFPSGGGEQNIAQPEFKSGFRFFLQQLPQEAMVYSFYTDPEQSRQLVKECLPDFAGLSSDVLTKGLFNINRFSETKTVKIDESYRPVGDWQEVLRNNKTDGKNNVLSEYFLSQFVI